MSTSTSRRTLPAMAACYCLGVFNDNYFKQAAMLLAVAAGLNQLQGWAAILFALPFILFSAHGGWCADRFPKRTVMIGAKGLEIIAMMLGGAGLVTGSWPLILAMVFTMGLQSAFFGPSLNSAIPELFEPARVPAINALLKLLSTLAILIGMAAAGISLDQNWMATGELPFGIVLISAVVMLIALGGFLASLYIGRSTSPAATARPLPWLGPLASVKHVAELARDRELGLAIIADSWFYFIASFVVLAVNSLGLIQLGLSQTLTSLLSVALMLGVCAGSYIAARLVVMSRWSGHLVPSSLAMAAGLLLAGATMHLPEALRFFWLAGSLALAGTAGGLFLIPVTSFLQLRPAENDKGRVIGASGFCSFSAILLSGCIYTLLESTLSPAWLLTALGLASIAASMLFAFLKSQERSSLVGIVLRRILALRYRVTVKGLDTLDLDTHKGTIFLPNHPALIDPVIVMSVLYDRFRPRPLSAKEQIDKMFVRQVMHHIRPIVLPETGRGGDRAAAVHRAINEVVASLRQGENVLFYPAGRLNRSSHEDLRANSGLEFISRELPDLQVVLVRTAGLWGSSFSRASGKAPSLTGKLKLYLSALLAGGIFFMPRREVTIELVRDTTLTGLGDRTRINSYLETWYNTTAASASAVPYFRWQSNHTNLPDETLQSEERDISHVPASIRHQVITKLEDLSGTGVTPGQSLANDLGLDSLTLLEMSQWLEQEFGVTIDDSAILENVADCILAAAGQLGQAEDETISPPPKRWFANSASPLALSPAPTITEAFLARLKENPEKVIVADRISGEKSYRQIATAIFALLPTLAKLEGERIGIMLPASVSATIVYLATLFAGKTPVLFNWTTGIANMEHGLKETGVNHIISARPLYTRLLQQGIELDSLETHWLHVDEVAQDLSMKQKIAALVKTYTAVGTLARARVPEIAAILFTSGSESRPKAVPLSQTNLITNLRDFTSLVPLAGDSRLLGMLPPFHSLGLVGTMVMPLCLGLPTVYHANPTEPAKLAAIIESYGVSMMIATPTFLHGILLSGTGKQLAPLRLVFTGAEKCPDHVRAGLARANPQAELCEGYGITECSPLVAINLPGASRPGTIGRVLPSIEYAVVDEALTKRIEPGRRGQLLVRGESIFSGYLNKESSVGFCWFEDKLWYQTGDFVADRDRHLVFLGRKKRFIKIAGEMISLPAIEEILLQHYGGADDGPTLAVEATPVDAHPEIVLFTTSDISRDEINGCIRKAGLSALHTIRKIISLEAIPVLGTGKTDYRTLRNLLAPPHKETCTTEAIREE